jgi:hypothetical protein
MYKNIYKYISSLFEYFNDINIKKTYDEDDIKYDYAIEIFCEV